MPDPVIAVEHVSKAYRIWNSPSSRLTAPVLEGAGGLMAGSPGQWLKDRAARSYRDFFALQDVSYTVRHDSLPLRTSPEPPLR